MLKAEKATVVDTLREDFAQAGVVIVTHYKGLTVAEVTTLRRQMLEAGAHFKVSKNTLTRLAVNDTDFAQVTELLTGPTALAYSADPVAAPKVVSEFAKKNDKLKILGGGFGGQLLNPEQVKALAEMPSLDELRAKIIALINTPATRIAGVLQAPAGQLARVLNAYATKDEG